MQIEHILAFTADPFHQKRIKDGNNIITDIINGINLLNARKRINQVQIIIYLYIKGTKSPDGHSTGKSRGRKADCIFGAPFDIKDFGVYEEYFCTKSTVEAKFEAF